ncbi:outer membrane lipoprotein carrier protein LolA [Verrucomicrobiota bacterium]
MKTFLLFLLLSPALSFAQETVAERLLVQYDKINTMSCEVRKTVIRQNDKTRTLSRIHFQKPDRIHVHNISPVDRYIIADGNNLYHYIKGDPHGFSSPITKLEESWLMQLRRVPGTAMDHLIRLKGVPETRLEPTTESPVRAGYQLSKVYAVLSLDDAGRLVQINFYKTPKMKECLAQHTYSMFQEILEGLWIPLLHKLRYSIAGTETLEISRISNIKINTHLSNDLFQPGSHLKGIPFAPLPASPSSNSSAK